MRGGFLSAPFCPGATSAIVLLLLLGCPGWAQNLPEGELLPVPQGNAPAPTVPDVAPPVATLALESGLCVERPEVCQDQRLLWEEQLSLEFLPQSLLWQVPWANPREPRMYAKFNNAEGFGQGSGNARSSIDTAIGAQIGLIRFAPEKMYEGIQLDMFAAVFTRFAGSALTAADYRVGIPLTYAKGPWQAKLGFEHTSAHLGDEFIERNFDQFQFENFRSFVRDEVVFGLARYLNDDIRVYGQVGYAVGKRRPPGGEARYFFGLEWTTKLDLRFPGQPFAAIDLDLRPEQDYQANTTIQVGWRYEEPVSRRAFRLGLEYYNGKTQYGKFFSRNEDFVGFGLYYDW